jgi:hypothetical protein
MSVSPIDVYLAALHERWAGDESGAVADYIPPLALADPSWFGIAIATTDGHCYEVGETRRGFTIQSTPSRSPTGWRWPTAASRRSTPRSGSSPAARHSTRSAWRPTVAGRSTR